MKKIITLLMFITILQFNGYAQEEYGKTLNLGVGIGYYGYVGHSLPVLHIDYEFDVAKDFTLAPFLNFYSYNNSYYWGDKQYPYAYYNNSVTIIPVGVKGTYYFDDLLHASPNWDFYLAASLGYTIVNSTWGDGYYGDRNEYLATSDLYLDLHIGAEYHLNKRLGIFLDLSTGVSTIGLAIHSIK